MNATTPTSRKLTCSLYGHRLHSSHPEYSYCQSKQFNKKLNRKRKCINPNAYNATKKIIP